MLFAPRKPRTKRRRRWLVALAVLSAVAIALGSCAQFGPPSTAEAFEGRPEPTTRTIATAQGASMFVAETGASGGPLVLFVHGSPGAWNDFAYVMANEELAKRAHLVSVDRLGWGGSAEKGLAPAMEDQAQALLAVLDAFPGERPVIVVGHSLGGPVAARLAMDAPERVDALLLVAASIDPSLEEPTWYQTLGRTWLIRPIVPDILARADDEIRPLKAELAAMAPLWAGLKLPVTVMHGVEDALVPIANADFAERVLTNARVEFERIEDQGHLIPWERPDAIVAALLRRIDAFEQR